MALYANSVRDPKTSSAYLPSDFFKVSYDNDQKKDRKLTIKEAKQLMGSKFKI